jgi:hypothetical protein
MVLNSYITDKEDIPYFPAHKMHFFFPEKCDVNSTCVLCVEDKYLISKLINTRTPIISTSLLWDSEICFQTMRSGITACEWLTFKKSIEKIQFSPTCDKNTGHFVRRSAINLSEFVLRWEACQDKICRESQNTHFIFNKFDYISFSSS